MFVCRADQRLHVVVVLGPDNGIRNPYADGIIKSEHEHIILSPTRKPVMLSAER